MNLIVEMHIVPRTGTLCHYVFSYGVVFQYSDNFPRVIFRSVLRK